MPRLLHVCKRNGQQTEELSFTCRHKACSHLEWKRLSTAALRRPSGSMQCGCSSKRTGADPQGVSHHLLLCWNTSLLLCRKVELEGRVPVHLCRFGWMHSCNGCSSALQSAAMLCHVHSEHGRACTRAYNVERKNGSSLIMNSVREDHSIKRATVWNTIVLHANSQWTRNTTEKLF